MHNFTFNTAQPTIMMFKSLLPRFCCSTLGSTLVWFAIQTVVLLADRINTDRKLLHDCSFGTDDLQLSIEFEKCSMAKLHLRSQCYQPSLCHKFRRWLRRCWRRWPRWYLGFLRFLLLRWLCLLLGLWRARRFASRWCRCWRPPNRFVWPCPRRCHGRALFVLLVVLVMLHGSRR